MHHPTEQDGKNEAYAGMVDDDSAMPLAQTHDLLCISANK